MHLDKHLAAVYAAEAAGQRTESLIRARYPDGLRDIVGSGPFGWSS